MRAVDGAPEEPPTDAETQRLARAAQGGEIDRFAVLYERIAPAVYTWAALRIRPAMRRDVDPQDVVQEVWCRAWKALPAYDPERIAFRPWVFRIAKNVLLEALRKLQRNPSPAGGPGPTTRIFQLQNLPDSASSISQRVARDEGVRTILEWVEGLDEEDRKLFVHCGLEGLTYAQVGERLQLHRETVAKRWQGLRRRLEKLGAAVDVVGT
jgi:RNA polymerase sigma-70 factor (ECF subfamily)